MNFTELGEDGQVKEVVRLPQNEDEERRALMMLIEEKKGHFQWSHRIWSGAYHFALFTAPVSAFATTLLSALEKPAIYTTIFGAATTLLAGIAAQGRFQDKWRATRFARSQLEQLRTELLAPGSNLDSIRDAFGKTLDQLDQSIFGPSSERLAVTAKEPPSSPTDETKGDRGR
jgi:hypothetical protein